MDSDSDDVWYRRLEAQWVIPGVLGFLYTVGFLVTNSHRAAYQPVRVELFEAQYLGAALLYTVITSIPMVIAHNAHVSAKVDGAGRSWRKYFGRLLFGFGAFAALFVVLIPPPGRLPSGLVGALLWPLYYCVLSMGFVLFLLERSDASDGSAAAKYDKSHLIVRTTIGLLLVFLSSIGVFSQTVYPRVSPVFGGGAKWIATLEVEAAADESHAVADSVLILDQSERFQTVLSCVARDGVASRAVLAVPNSRIEAIQYTRMTSTGAYLGRLDRFGCVPSSDSANDEEGDTE